MDFAFPQSPKEVDYTFAIARPAEVTLQMKALAPGTSWREPGAEAAVVRLDLDGQYNQHVTLFMGATAHEYRLLLGPLAAGKHALRAVLDRKLSSPAAAGFLANFEAHTVEPGDSEYDALRYAPILYARPDTLGHATDTPLITWYEWLPPSSDAPPGSVRMLQYSYIFTNEDEGTKTPALLSRWGRTTDIEHVYRLFLDARGNSTGAIFQAVEHKETPFAGQRLGDHPLIGVASKNNNFSDQPTSNVRIAFWPERADLSEHSREELMDLHPWSYRVMAEELEREGKMKEVGDPRNYVYIEARLLNSGAYASFGVRLKDGKTYRANRGEPELGIERSGWVRTAVPLPPGARLEDITNLWFYCDPLVKPHAVVREQFCSVEAISKTFLLDQDYRPGLSSPMRRGLPLRLAPGRSAGLLPATGAP